MTDKTAALKAELRDWSRAYVVVAVWSLVFAVLTPTSITLAGFSTTVTILVPIAAVTGAVVALIGIRRQDNLNVERAGLIMLMGAPALYGLLQLGTALFEVSTIGTSQRWHLVLFAFLPVVLLLPRFRKLGRLRHEAANTPLPVEEEASVS